MIALARTCRRCLPRVVCAGALALIVAGSVRAQLTPDQMAEMILNSAKKAYNEKQYPVAVQRFNEFLAKFAGHKDAPQARYGLALAILDGPDKNHEAALAQLQPLTGIKDFPDAPHVLYYLGLAQRGLGVKLLAQAVAQPPQAPQFRQQAAQRFDEAAKQFAAAAPAFLARVKDVPKDAKELPADVEWAARSYCDQAEMLLRNNKSKEAQAAVAPFLKDALLHKSRYRHLALYYHGFASFLVSDFQTAGRSLTQLAPFADPVFGMHAHYLLARTHHLQPVPELTEASQHYQGVIDDYGKHKQEAIKRLQQPQQFANDPEEKARLEMLVKEAPDYVSRSAFYLGVIQYEGGKYGDALARFTAFPTAYPQSPLQLEAQLRAGFCQVQLKEFANAAKTLHPILEKDPRLADQALLWFGKAQVGIADPGKPQEFDQVVKSALDTFRKAADKAQQLMQADPEAKQRKGDILIELGDTQQLAKQYKEAAGTYDQVLNEKLIPQRDEELLSRRVAALQLAGDYPGSDQACARYQQAFPKGILMASVLFRHAENAYFSALNAEKIPDPNQRANETKKWYDETAKRYQTVIDKAGEFANVNIGLARYGLGMVHYRRQEFEKARALFETIPAADRNGDLAVTPYLIADCLIRTAPTKIDDALAAGKLEEQLKGASEQLEGFIGADAKSPLVPDALLKLGLCQQRMAGLQGQPPERAKAFAVARGTYEKLMQQFPQHPLMPQAVLERAKCISQQGDKGGAMNELRRFTGDPLKNTNVAPMAMLQLATLLREVNQPAEAVKVLGDCRQQHEPNLAKDPERAHWIGLLQYHQAVALREAGKFAEARGLFDNVSKTAGNRPEASDAALRSGQCLLQEAHIKIDAAQKRLATPNLKPEEIQAGHKALEEGFNNVRQVVQYFEQQTEQWRQKQPAAEGRARMYYEAAWASRTLAGPEVAAARTQLQQAAQKKAHEEALKKDPNWKPPAIEALPDVALSAVPLTPSETKCRGFYQTLIKEFADAPLAIDGRFELAELLAERDDFAPAVQLLTQAIDKEPGPELTEKIRLRLGALYATKKDVKSALEQFDAVANNPKSPLAGQAHYRAGECLLALKDYPKAATRLAIFRDNPQFHNVPGVSDRALLRLGHALALQNQWGPSRQAHETLLGRFGASPWVHEARYGIGWALQNEKQYDQAVNFYNQVTAGTSTELGAKAQLQIGLCRLDQKRFPEASAALLVVPFTYDYPELSAVALCEAARSLIEEKKPDQAEKLLQRVIKDHPQSEWAKVAKERLDALKKG
jgi:TolA-binding protein